MRARRLPLAFAPPMFAAASASLGCGATGPPSLEPSKGAPEAGAAADAAQVMSDAPPPGQVDAALADHDTHEDSGSGVAPDSGGSGCAGHSYLLCDDFESGALSSVWQTTVSHGAITVDATHTAQGAYA